MELGRAIAGAASAALSLTFLVAAIAKTFSADELRRAVAGFQLGGGDPKSVRVTIVAVTVPVVEFLLALSAALWVGARWPIVLVGIALLTVFTTASIGVIRRGEQVQCACFGITSTSRSEPISWRHVARNVVLAALWIPAAIVAPAEVWASDGAAAGAVIVLAGACVAMLLMELPTVLSVGFAPPAPSPPAHGSAQ